MWNLYKGWNLHITNPTANQTDEEILGKHQEICSNPPKIQPDNAGVIALSRAPISSLGTGMGSRVVPEPSLFQAEQTAFVLIYLLLLGSFLAFLPGVRQDKCLTSIFNAFFPSLHVSFSLLLNFSLHSVYLLLDGYQFFGFLLFSEASHLIENAVIGCCFFFLFSPTSILSLQGEQNHETSEVKQALKMLIIVRKKEQIAVLWNFLYIYVEGNLRGSRGGEGFSKA